jgi:HTH-type transcriptional regulator / antitoxin HigA
MATKTKITGKAETEDRGDVSLDDPGDKKEVSSSKAGTRSKSKHPVAARGTDPAYFALIQRFALRPIRTDAELDAASALIDELTDRDDLSPAEADYLDVLGDLVENYEDEHVEMPHVSDADMLRSLMDEKGVRQSDVVRGTGLSKTVLSLVLNGKRDLTREHIETLAKYFGVNPAAFLGSG